VIRRGRPPIISPEDSPPRIDLNNTFAAIDPSQQSDSDDEQTATTNKQAKQANPLSILYHSTTTAITTFQP